MDFFWRGFIEFVIVASAILAITAVFTAGLRSRWRQTLRDADIDELRQRLDRLQRAVEDLQDRFDAIDADIVPSDAITRK